MANPLGDFDTSAVIYGKFVTTSASTAAPTTLSGSAVLSVYKDNSTTQSTAGVTLTVDFDSVTGFNHYAVDTSADGTFYSAGSFYDIVVTTGTVGGTSAVGYCVGSFTLRKTSALKPTTAGRALDVSAGGEAGLDWANIGSPTTTNSLTGTSMSSSQVVASVTARVMANADQWAGTTIPAPTVTGVPKVDLVDIGGVALSTASAQLGVNVVEYAAGKVPLQPTTASRTLNVTATGEAGIDWGDVVNQSTTVSLSNTTIKASSIPTTAQIATAVWQDATAGDFTAVGSIGKDLFIGGVTPGAAGGHFIAGTNAATTVTTALTTTFTGNLTGSVGSLAAQAQTDVKTQVVAALSSDTYAEPGQGVPPATTTLANKIGYNYKAWRNKSTQTASEYDLFADDATTVDQKASVSDDGTTFTRGEVATGP